MYCKICGNILQGNEAYCPVCGAVLTQNQPEAYPEFQPSGGMRQPEGYKAEPEGRKKPPFIKTTAGKLTVGIAAVVLAGGIAAGCLIYRHVKNEKQTADQETEETVAANTGSEAASAEDTTAAPDEDRTEDSSEAMSEASSEDTTEVTAETEQAENIYKEAYKTVLEVNEAAINAYTWQVGYGSSETPSPIVFCDITGDEIPEMITIQAPSGVESYVAELVIYTVENGAAEQIYTTMGEEFSGWDVEAASGTAFYLFTRKGETGLYAYKGIGDESYDDMYIQFGFDDSGVFGEIHTWLKTTGPNEDYTDTVVVCSKDGKEISEEAFNEQREAFEADLDRMLMYENQAKTEVQRITGSLECEAVTYEEALAYVSDSEAGQNAGTAADVIGKLPSGMPSSFVFSSGVGAWWSDLTLNADGTFVGSYHDSDMGDAGDDYPNGTVYTSSVTGNFKNIQKVDRYTYRMELDTCDLEKESGEEWIEDGVRYVSSEFYGISGGEVFYLYLPGALMSNLPEYVASWAETSYYSGTEDSLTCYILYSEESGGVFIGTAGEDAD